MVYRMQTSVSELMDIQSEPKRIHELYGTEPGKTSFANNCLLARRLVERGVRFVQLFDQGWDMHGSVFDKLPQKTRQVDQPIAALIRDLKERGLLEDTLVVWNAEFGRTPMAQGTSGTGEARLIKILITRSGTGLPPPGTQRRSAVGMEVAFVATRGGILQPDQIGGSRGSRLEGQLEAEVAHGADRARRATNLP
jgi:hypothetical protein